jgi:hypothetical protein
VVLTSSPSSSRATIILTIPTAHWKSNNVGRKVGMGVTALEQPAVLPLPEQAAFVCGFGTQFP